VQKFKKYRIVLKECRERKHWHNPKQTGRYVHDVWNKERRREERTQKHDSELSLKGISIRPSGKAFVLFCFVLWQPKLNTSFA
jgi:IS5 family transposase